MYHKHISLSAQPTIGMFVSSASKWASLTGSLSDAIKFHDIDIVHNKYGSLLNIVIGGDGTLISTVRNAVDLKVPFLAVKGGTYNAGPLVTPDLAVSTLRNFLDGTYCLNSRNTLSCMLPLREIGADDYGHARFGFSSQNTVSQLIINEIIIQNAGAPRLHVGFSGRTDIAKEFDANGFLLSTAMGSTGENASYGGKEISHDFNWFVFTPIAPFRNLKRPNQRQAYSHLFSFNEDVTATVKYLKKSYNPEMGLSIDIDNLDRTYIPRFEGNKEINPFELIIRRGPDWRLLEPAK